MYTVKVITKYTSRYDTATQIIGEWMTRAQVNAALESFGRVSGWRVDQRYRIGSDEYLHGGIVQRQFVIVTES